MISYRSKWPAGWKSEWFYVKVGKDKEKLVQSPLELIFGETRPRCRMTAEGPTWTALAEFKIIAEHIGTRDLVQEFLAFRVFPTMKEWTMPKLKREKKEAELVRLYYKFKKYFKAPCQEWLDTIEIMSNEILGNYSKKEDQLMTAAFDTRPKRRLNRVLDAIGFEYTDYGRLGGDAGGPKRKRIASATDEEVAKVTKKNKKDSEKLSPGELNPELKVATTRKSKSASPEPEPETLVREEGTPASPSAVEVEEIMKVMTEPLPIRLSPLALELTKFFQKDKAVSADEGPALPKKRRIIQIADVIHGTPSPTPAQQTAETAEAKGAAAEATRAEIFEAETGAAEAVGAEIGATEDLSLEETLEVIDNILLKMTEEESVVAATSTATEKGKNKLKTFWRKKILNFKIYLGKD
jgi:hypothetical protein